MEDPNLGNTFIREAARGIVREGLVRVLDAVVWGEDQRKILNRQELSAILDYDGKRGVKEVFHAARSLIYRIWTNPGNIDLNLSPTIAVFEDVEQKRPTIFLETVAFRVDSSLEPCHLEIKWRYEGLGKSYVGRPDFPKVHYLDDRYPVKLVHPDLRLGKLDKQIQEMEESVRDARKRREDWEERVALAESNLEKLKQEKEWMEAVYGRVEK